jgi:1-deoxy-D-xylulose-5-phosphate synthase
MVDWKTPLNEIQIGKGRRLKTGSDIAFLSIGPIGNYVVQACEQLTDMGINAAHYDMRFAKPIDELLLHEVFGKFKHVITVEDGCVQGGMGSAVIEFMADHGYSAQVKRLGIPDEYIEHGTQDELYTECGFDIPSMIRVAQEMCQIEHKSILGA